MPGRTYNVGNYRYGFNGKENDNDVKGEGNQQDYGMRIYDPRVGRFLSVDPLTKEYPWYTPYQFAGNKPIWAIDLDGAEEEYKAIVRESIKQAKLQQLSAAQTAYKNTPHFRPYNPSNTSWTSKWKNSNGFVSKISYSIVNGLFTTGQQLSSSLTGQEKIQNIGGGSYDAKGAFGEKQRIENFVSSASLLVPAAAAEEKGVGLFSKFLLGFETKASNQIVTKIEQKVVEQAAKGGLPFSKGVLENFTKHAFAGGRHADLGLSVESMASKGMNLIEKNISLLKAGDNTLIGNINGIQKSFKAFVKDGKIMSVNMYPGVSNRVTQGTVIKYGNVTW